MMLAGISAAAAAIALVHKSTPTPVGPRVRAHQRHVTLDDLRPDPYGPMWFRTKYPGNYDIAIPCPGLTDNEAWYFGRQRSSGLRYHHKDWRTNGVAA